MIGKLWRRLRGDQRGVSAVEFALIAPALIACYFGLAEMCGALMAERKVSHIASAIGDLVAQGTSMDSSGIADIWTVANTLMAPMPTTSLCLRVSSITADPTSGKTSIAWTQSQGTWTGANASPSATVPAGVVSPGGSVIMSESAYTYTSPISDFIPVPMTFNEKYYLAPRQSVSVVWSTT